MIHPDSHNFFVRVIKSPLGKLIARPWFDRRVAWFLETWFFPLSRLWAAARASSGDVNQFVRVMSFKTPSSRQRKKIQKALNHFERCRLKAFSTEKLWDDFFFGKEDVPPNRLPIVEEMRLDFRTAYNLSRLSFISFRKLVKTSVLMAPPTPEQVAEKYGAEGEHIGALFTLKGGFPEVEKSRPVPTPAGQDYWIRFPSPSKTMNDLVYARVHEPLGIEDPPTLVFGHGICVEFDHYKQLIDEVTDLTRMGIRVIRPESPWHGRRVLPGHFGGEQLLSGIPASMIEFFSAQHHEWAAIINWVRSNGDAPIALGGSSLGAQTAKAIAVRASEWPEHLQPQALLAITHSQHIYEGATKGSLSDIWHLGASLKAKGWHENMETAWLEKLDPMGKPCMPGKQIISVIGDRDTVTPSELALQQLDYWEVPKKNRYHYDRGHFTVPLGMINDDRILKALAGILKDC